MTNYLNKVNDVYKFNNYMHVLQSYFYFYLFTLMYL
jgi:hypothetical protein